MMPYRYRDNYGNDLAQGNRLDPDGLQTRPDGGVVQPGPATYRREGSSGSMTTMTNDPVNNAYMSLFASARTPADQQAIRSQYASSLLGAEHTRRRSEEEDAALRRRMAEGRYGLERDQFGLDRERFGLEGELARGRMGMQGSLANALAEAMGSRQSFFGGMPQQTQSGRSSSQRGYGMNLGDETRNYLMRFLKG